MTSIAISDSKANRLFWLGRYAERVYLSLHFLRRYFDMYLDGNPVDFATYAKNLGPDVKENMSFKEFSNIYMFDKSNQSSIMSCLNCANDNAILLREVIKSESLSYIQMSICYLERMAVKNFAEDSIPSMQLITDNLLAFFGSIEERLFDDKALAFVRYGRFIESLDMHMRFDYRYSVVREVFNSLLRWTEIEQSVFDDYSLKRFDLMLDMERYEINDSLYKKEMLEIVNRMVVI